MEIRSILEWFSSFLEISLQVIRYSRKCAYHIIFAYLLFLICRWYIIFQFYGNPFHFGMVFQFYGNLSPSDKTLQKEKAAGEQSPAAI